MPRSAPSQAVVEAIERVRARRPGLSPTASQVERLQRAGVLPRGRHVHLGRRRGSEILLPEGFEDELEVAVQLPRGQRTRWHLVLALLAGPKPVRQGWLDEFAATMLDDTSQTRSLVEGEARQRDGDDFASPLQYAGEHLASAVADEVVARQSRRQPTARDGDQVDPAGELTLAMGGLLAALAGDDASLPHAAPVLVAAEYGSPLGHLFEQDVTLGDDLAARMAELAAGGIDRLIDRLEESTFEAARGLVHRIPSLSPAVTAKPNIEWTLPVVMRVVAFYAAIELGARDVLTAICAESAVGGQSQAIRERPGQETPATDAST